MKQIRLVDLFFYIFPISIVVVIFVSHKVFYKIKANCWDDIHFKQVERQLLGSQIKAKIPLHEYQSISERSRKNIVKKLQREKLNPYLFILYFDRALKAVLKQTTAKEQKHEWALMFYQFSQLMNFKFVPPTVVRYEESQEAERVGITQLFVDGFFIYEKDLIKNLSLIEQSEIYIFYFLFGGIDPHKHNILLDKNCRRVALIDNDWNTLSYIKFGDFPFRYYKIDEKAMPVLTVEDYNNFPIHRVQSLKIDLGSEVLLKKLFHKLEENKSTEYIEAVQTGALIDDTMYFVKWKNGYWLKRNYDRYEWLFKDFKPLFFSRKTIRHLKALNRRNLNWLFSVYSQRYNVSMDKNFQKSYISSILYKRDLLLKEARRLE